MFTQILDNQFNDSIRKHVIIFGSLFNSIYTKTERNGEIQKRRVPISYGPKEKFIRLIIEESGITDKTHIQADLPRMAFEIVNLQYDPIRRINRLTEKRKIINNVPFRSYSEAPYNFTIALYCFSRSTEHNLQIIEQIVPYFAPDFTVTVNMTPLNTKVDIPILLNDVDVNEEYEGSFDSRRALVSTLSFTMKSYIYSPILTDNRVYIENIDINLYKNNFSNFISDFGFTGNPMIGFTSAHFYQGGTG
jgi:hypothetical protein